MTTRQTRGAENRKFTPKYELFQKAKKTNETPKKATPPEEKPAEIENLVSVLNQGSRLVKTTQLALEQ